MTIHFETGSLDVSALWRMLSQNGSIVMSKSTGETKVSFVPKGERLMLRKYRSTIFICLRGEKSGFLIRDGRYACRTSLIRGLRATKELY